MLFTSLRVATRFAHVYNFRTCCKLHGSADTKDLQYERVYNNRISPLLLHNRLL